MTALVKSAMNGLSGSSSEAVTEGAGRATGETASGGVLRRAPEVIVIARLHQFFGSEKRRLLAEADRCKEAADCGRSVQKLPNVVPASTGPHREAGQARALLGWQPARSDLELQISDA